MDYSVILTASCIVTNLCDTIHLMKKATCHKERDVFARGLCQSCYQKVLRSENIEKFRARDRERAKLYRNRHPEKCRKRNRESYRRHAEKRIIHQKVKAYGITEEQYRSMITKANGVCAICRLKVSQLTVDHDHKTNRVRGMLCHKCNQAIGLFGENVKTMQRAIKYLYVYKKI